MLGFLRWFRAPAGAKLRESWSVRRLTRLVMDGGRWVEDSVDRARNTRAMGTVELS